MRCSPQSVETFLATIRRLGINPYVSVPRLPLAALLAAAGRETSPIPIRVEIGGATFRQNLVRYQGAWRLYLNTPMRVAAGKDVGQRVALRVLYDPAPRPEPVPAELERALAEQPRARTAFLALSPSRRKEISRYLNAAKTTATRERNVAKVVGFLLGDEPQLVVLGGQRRAAGPEQAGSLAARTRAVAPGVRSRGSRPPLSAASANRRRGG
jgi:hypothetical protein